MKNKNFKNIAYYYDITSLTEEKIELERIRITEELNIIQEKIEKIHALKVYLTSEAGLNKLIKLRTKLLGQLEAIESFQTNVELGVMFKKLGIERK